MSAQGKVAPTLSDGYGNGSKKKPRCEEPGCRSLVARVTGECEYCLQLFCSRHRQLEAHECIGLEEVVEEARDANTDNIYRQATSQKRR